LTIPKAILPETSAKMLSPNALMNTALLSRTTFTIFVSASYPLIWLGNEDKKVCVECDKNEDCTNYPFFTCTNTK
jgi:hypothetical protein